MNTVPIEVVDEPKVGTATWMIPPTVKEVFPYSEGAIWLGRNGDDARTPVGRKDESHVLLCAMNRAAKGRAIITNNLILWPGSMFCNDPKGENASVTAARRGQGSGHTKQFLGQKVCVLDSHHTAKVEDRYRAYYNVLDELDPTHHSTPAKAENIVASFVTDDVKADKTWDEMAIAYMKALILHIITAPPSQSENDGYIPADERDLITFRRMVQTGDFYAVRHIESALPAEELAKKRPNAHMLLLKQMSRNQAFDGIIADEALNLLDSINMQPKLWNSIRVSAGLATKWIDDPMMRTVLRAGKYATTFRAEELETDPGGVSVYVCLKLEDQKRLAAWPRLITNMVLSAAQTEYFRSPATGHNTLMMLDEFAALERMRTIEQAAPAIAGAGIKLFMVLQNLSQMKVVYGDNFEAFMANAGTHIYYGFNDNFTAEYVKKRLGEIEVIRYMRSSNTAIGTGKSTSDVRGGGSQEGSSEGTSSGKTRGWSPSLFHLSLFTSKQKTRNSQSGTSSSTSENWSRAEQEQRSETNTEGWQQQLHKKPLADIHELMQMFGAIDDEDAPNFPGIGLISTAENAPALIQKSFYDQDRTFEGKFDPHPKHGFTPLPSEPKKFEKPDDSIEIIQINPISEYRNIFFEFTWQHNKDRSIKEKTFNPDEYAGHLTLAYDSQNTSISILLPEKVEIKLRSEEIYLKNKDNPVFDSIYMSSSREICMRFREVANILNTEGFKKFGFIIDCKNQCIEQFREKNSIYFWKKWDDSILIDMRKKHEEAVLDYEDFAKKLMAQIYGGQKDQLEIFKLAPIHRVWHSGMDMSEEEFQKYGSSFTDHY